ncbi:MAG: hypothetical protein J2P49_02740 [Methylocapsa sp.]|nr:hypothetical protein [Methylocapsa sp.]
MASDHSRLTNALEPGQLTSETQRPLPRRELGRKIVALLVLLRIYVIIAIPVVCYAFFHAVLAGK